MRLSFPFRPAALLLLTLASQAQGPVATKAGLIYFAEGTVLLNNQPLMPGQGQLLFVEEGGAISTVAGRAELLIGTANYLRLGEDTIVRMLSSDLSGVELRLETGVIMLEVGEASQDTPITVQCVSSKVQIGRRGLYRVDQGSAKRLKVFDGRAQVHTAEGGNLVKEGWMIGLPPESRASEPHEFPRKQKDAFDLWSADRSNQLARTKASRPGDSATLGGELQPMYSPQTSPRAKRFPDGRSN
jgi:hypothetical protein